MFSLRKKIYLGLFIGTIISCCSIYSQWPDNNLHLIFCDVGQGDAIVVSYGFHQMLIDGGPPNNRALDCLYQHLPWWDRKIDILLASHPDADHIGGLDVILQAYTVSNIIWNGDIKNTAVFDRFYSSLQREKTFENAHATTGINNPALLSPQVQIITLSPLVQHTKKDTRLAESSESTLQDIARKKSSSTEEINDGSIAVKVTYNQIVALLMADTPKGVEAALCQTSLLEPTNILKVAHHGSKSSTSDCFLERTRPEISILSVGKNNRYGHPSPEVMSTLVSSGSQIIRTDEVGTIELVTNGQRVWQKH